MSRNTKKREPVAIRAEHFHTLHLAALMFGGVGAGSIYRLPALFPREQYKNYPNCVLGLASAADIMEPGQHMRDVIGLDVVRNDEVVREYLHKHPNETKMPWNKYVKAYPIVCEDEA